MKRTIRLIAIVVISVAAIYSFSYSLTCDITEAVKLSSELIGTVSTICTLIIAFKLFDQFDQRKKFIDKQVDTVIELIDFLRKYSFQVQGKSVVYMLRFLSDLSIYKNTAVFEQDKDKRVLIKGGRNFIIPVEIDSFLSNLWLPKEIKVHLRFLLFEGSQIAGVDEVDKNKFVFIIFDKDVQEYVVSLREMTFAQFISNIENLMNILNEWIKSHTNNELNFNKND